MISDLVFGGITGLVGGIAQKWADYKTKKLELEMQQKKHENEIAMRKVDAEIMQQEWAARTKVAEVEADSKAFEASHNEPELYSEKVAPTVKQGWLLVFVDFLRGIVRPFLTLYLCAVTTVMYMRTDGGSINPQSVVDTVLFLTTTAVCWWYGSRGNSK
jgi:hypothetical protein